jgi:uncharacterized delta-60 repeat protein
MSSQTKIAGVWRDVTVPYVKVAGAWKVAKSAFIKVGGQWKNWFLQNGVLDTAFSSNLPFSEFTEIRNVKCLPNGKVLLTGDWQVPVSKRIVILNSDGSEDLTTTISGFSYVNDVLVLPNGNFLLGRDLRVALVGLNSNLSSNTTFGTFNTRELLWTGDTGGLNTVRVNALRNTPSGNIIVGGRFDRYNGLEGTLVNNLVQFDSSGTLDSTFVSNVGTTTGSVQISKNCIAVQPDGKVIIVGGFDSFNGVFAPGIVRLNSSGTIDTAFMANISNGFTGSPSMPNSVFLQSDGKILVSNSGSGGGTAVFNSTNIGRLVRLNSDGTHDTSLNTLSLPWAIQVFNFLPLSSGKIFIYGQANTSTGCTLRKGVNMLNSDGSVDPNFLTNVGSGVGWPGTPRILDAAEQPDGKILFAGRMSSYNGVTSNLIARIGGDGSFAN